MSAAQSGNVLAKTSLGLGLASSVLVFGIGLFALIAARRGWLPAVGLPLLICGASSAFLGLLGVILGFGALAGSRVQRLVALMGLLVSLLGICLFLGVMAALRAGA